MSSTTSSSAAPSFSGGGLNNGQPSNNNNNGVSSSLYLFTFLITVLVLALISAALLFRAYYIRRRFQLRVEDAIRAGRPLPPDAARALGLTRPGGPNGKKDKKLGPMPVLWEAEMLIDRKAAEAERGQVGREEWEDRMSRRWEEFEALSVVHFPKGGSTPESYLPEYIIPPPHPRRWYLPSWVPETRPLPRPAVEAEQTPANIPRRHPKFIVPSPGEDVTVGVLIALPFEDKVDELWTRENEDEEREVPQVCLGVVAAKIE